MIKNLTLGQFVRFGFTGIFNALVDFGILNVLVKVFHLSPVVANIFSFSSAVVVSYFINKYWTFKDHEPTHLRQFPIFAGVSLVGLGLSSWLLHFGTQVLVAQTAFPLSFTWSYNLAKGISAVIVLVWNFLAYKFLVFKK